MMISTTQVSTPTLDTPWGPAEWPTPLGLDVLEVTTTSHGGIGVRGDTAKKLSRAARAEAIRQDGWYWFEEDCDWANVCHELPELFSERDRELATGTLKRWHQPYLEQLRLE